MVKVFPHTFQFLQPIHKAVLRIHSADDTGGIFFHSDRFFPAYPTGQRIIARDPPASPQRYGIDLLSGRMLFLRPGMTDKQPSASLILSDLTDQIIRSLSIGTPDLYPAI